MALTARQRSTLYEKFSNLIGDEEADALLSQFPTNDLETPATKDFVRAECIALKSEVVHELDVVRTELKTEIHELRTEMTTEFAAVRTEMHHEFAAVRTEMTTEFAAVRSEIAAESKVVGAQFAGIRTDIAGLRAELHRELRLHLVATLTLMAVLLTAFRLF